MDCRNCGRELSAENGELTLSASETRLYVCPDCWTWTEDAVG